MTCCDLQDQIMWELRDDNYLDGISVDSYGNAYVIGIRKVIVIFLDGQESEELLNESHGINRFTSLYNDRQRNKMLVSNFQGGCAFLFSIIV